MRDRTTGVVVVVVATAAAAVGITIAIAAKVLSLLNTFRVVGGPRVGTGNTRPVQVLLNVACLVGVTSGDHFRH